MIRLLALLPVLIAFQAGVPPALAWTWPADGPVLRAFSFEGDPYAAGHHRGIDVAAEAGAPVRAPAAGVVSFAGTVPGGGRTVTLQTADGYSVTLVHLGMIRVAREAILSEGAPVGTIGPTGDAEHAEPYVHLGIRLTSDAQGYLDPLSFLPGPRPAAPARPQHPPTRFLHRPLQRRQSPLPRAKRRSGCRSSRSRPRALSSRPRRLSRAPLRPKLRCLKRPSREPLSSPPATSGRPAAARPRVESREHPWACATRSRARASSGRGIRGRSVRVPPRWRSPSSRRRARRPAPGPSSRPAGRKTAGSSRSPESSLPSRRSCPSVRR